MLQLASQQQEEKEVDLVLEAVISTSLTVEVAVARWLLELMPLR
jgi:hypothetical protein